MYVTIKYVFRRRFVDIKHIYTIRGLGSVNVTDINPNHMILQDVEIVCAQIKLSSVSKCWNSIGSAQPHAVHNWPVDTHTHDMIKMTCEYG